MKTINIFVERRDASCAQTKGSFPDTVPGAPSPISVGVSRARAPGTVSRMVIWYSEHVSRFSFCFCNNKRTSTAKYIPYNHTITIYIIIENLITGSRFMYNHSEIDILLISRHNTYSPLHICSQTKYTYATVCYWALERVRVDSIASSSRRPPPTFRTSHPPPPTFRTRLLVPQKNKIHNYNIIRAY